MVYTFRHLVGIPPDSACSDRFSDSNPNSLMCFNHTQTSIRADYPSKKSPMLLVLRLISRFDRSMALFECIRFQCSLGKTI